MLPSPISSASQRRKFRQSVYFSKNTTKLLLSRTRLTNLAVIILGSVCFLSLLFNLGFYLFPPTPSHSFSTSAYGGNYRHGILATINRNPSLSHLHHLVIVPCHAIWIGTDVKTRLAEENWILESYQKGGNRVAAFFEHIQRSAEIVAKDGNALLVFSGGQTRLKSTTTEAESYLRLAIAANVFHGPSFERATTEDHALDSYQNLLFSIARFREFTGQFPKMITVVGYEFKRARFTELHRAAIRWPKDNFHYIGVDPDNEHSRNAEQGERANGYLPYSVDKYGCNSVLLSKRRQRNPFSRFHSYYVSSPELGPLIDWCPAPGGESTIFPGNLPWTA